MVTPAVISSSQMMPMVFCASLLPCPMLYSADETSCRRRNQASTRLGDARRQAQDTAIISSAPSVIPSIGEMKMKAAVLSIPGASSGPVPDLASVAPIIPPISACEELDGMP